MKIALLYDGKLEATKQIAIFLAEKMQANNHYVRLFRTTETKSQELIVFQPVILLATCLHPDCPVQTFKKCLKDLGKSRQEISIGKAGIYNYNTIINPCDRIGRKLIKIFPGIELFQKSIPVKPGGQLGSLSGNWKEDATDFISNFLNFISQD